MPATIVGSANGRSISALMSDLPRKRSRTSTHATSVPATAFIAATRIDMISVSFSAATACGAVMASTNAPRPPSVERATTAASGISTTTLSHSVATPSDSAADPPGAAAARGRRRKTDPPAAGAEVRASLGSGDPRRLLDLRDRALVRVEEVVVDLRPAAEVADREEALRRRELGLVGVEDLLVDRPVAPVGERLLGLRREREAQERLGLRRVAGLREDGDRVLDEDRLVGDDVVDLLSLLLRRDRLVLVGDQHVAGARREVLQRLATRLVLHDDVLRHELAEVVEAGRRVLAPTALGAVRGEDVPLRRAGRERVRREDLDARVEEVVPGADVLRIALAHDEADDRARDEALRRRVRPVARHEAGLDEAVHVGREGERDDVGGEAGLHRAALVARRAERLAERDAAARLRLLKLRDDLVVDDLRRGVGDERQARLGAAAAGGAARRAAARRVVGATAGGDHERGGEEHGEQSERAWLHEEGPPKSIKLVGIAENSEANLAGGESRESRLAMPISTAAPPASLRGPVDYPVESFTAAERARLAPHVTNLDRPVFALVTLPETVKGALFARYSRYQGTLRRLFLDEFADSLPEVHTPWDAGEGARAAKLYERIFLGYGDDSVAQLGGVHVAAEWVSNVLTKVLQRPRLAAYLEQSTRYIPYDAPMPGGGYRYRRDASLGPQYARAMDALFAIYSESLPRVTAWADAQFPP